MIMTSTLQQAHQSYFRAVAIGRLAKFGCLILFLSFAVWTIYHLNIPLERIFGIFGRVGHMFVERMMPPDMVYALQPGILYRIVETIEMTFLGAFVGTCIAIFVSWFAAWNVTPSKKFLYPLGRGVLSALRPSPRFARPPACGQRTRGRRPATSPKRCVAPASWA